MGVELHLLTLSKCLAKSAFDSLISHNMAMMASELCEVVDGCVTGGKLLTVSLFPKYEPFDFLLITFLAFVTEIRALAEAVIRFLVLGNIFRWHFV